MVDIFATRLYPPFGLSKPTISYFVDPFTESMIDELKKDRRFSNLGVAIVDLTHRGRRADGAGFITSSGWNLGKFGNVASLVKICAMFAVFRMKENLTFALNETGAKTGAEAFKAVESDWKSAVETAVVNGRPDFPRFGQIFNIAGSQGGWTLTFTKDFMHHMELMIGESKNSSAAFCIDRIGFQYLNGALEAEGFYSAENLGMWLGGNYGGRSWMSEPKTKLTHQGATAKSVAEFLTLVEDGRLVSADASKDMRRIMGLAGTWFFEGLSQAKPPRAVSSSYAKVGIYGKYHDCAVIERGSRQGKLIRYGIVTLFAPDPDYIRKIAVKLDDYVLASN
jgi:hypothetical protein